MRFVIALLVLCGACSPAGLGFRMRNKPSPIQHLQSRTVAGTEIKRGHVRLDVTLASSVVVVRATRLDECMHGTRETYANDHGVVTATREGASVSTPCPVPATDTIIHLALPSGAALELTTDERGQALVALPSTDVPASAADIRATVPTFEVVIPQPSAPRQPSPAVGPVVATTPIAPTVGTAEKPRTGMALVRDALITCGDKYAVRGLVRVKLTLADHAEIKAAKTNHGGEFQACVESSLRGQRLPISRPPGQLEFPYYIK